MTSDFMQEENDGFQPIGGKPLMATLSMAIRGFCGDDAEGQLDFALERVPEHLRDSTRNYFKIGYPKCESPIERQIFPWLLCQEYKCFDHPPLVLLPGETDRLPEQTVAVIPQLQIGKRRVDFALAAKRRGPVRFVIVECDGAAYHSDVQKDVERDAELMRFKRILDVHPIAGTDIFKDARNAAFTASKALTFAWAKNNPATDRKFASDGA